MLVRWPLKFILVIVFYRALTLRDSKRILSWSYDRECFAIYYEVAMTIANGYQSCNYDSELIVLYREFIRGCYAIPNVSWSYDRYHNWSHKYIYFIIFIYQLFICYYFCKNRNM